MERENIQKRIIQILLYINHPIKQRLQENMGLFSQQELSQILEFLETWSLNPIYDFLEDKKKEYIDIINSLKVRKKYVTLSNIKLKERLEMESEQKEIELIDFNY